MESNKFLGGLLGDIAVELQNKTQPCTAGIKNVTTCLRDISAQAMNL